MTKLSDMPEIFKTDHERQSTWIDGQIKKNNGAIFLNQVRAEAAYAKLKDDSMGLIDNRDLEKFVARYFSPVGLKKLNTTLRVAKSRSEAKSFRLQCNIDYSANSKLERFMQATGLGKGELLTKLIELADLEKIETKETQFEITL